MTHTTRQTFKAACTALVLAMAMFSMISCNDTTKSYTAICITHFGFDSFPAFDDYTFYIDNISHTIYNTDSFPYKSDVTSLYPTIVAGNDNGTFTMNGKSWSQKDTMSFAECPIQMVFTSDAGTYTYNIHVNVHKQDPDSLQMRFAGSVPAANEYRTVLVSGTFALVESNGTNHSLYLSDNCEQWSASKPVSIPLAAESKAVVNSLLHKGNTAFITDDQGGLYASRTASSTGVPSADSLIRWNRVENVPYIVSLIGIMEGRSYPIGAADPDALLAIVKNKDRLHFARIEGDWISGFAQPVAVDSCLIGDSIPEGFPVNGFATCIDCTVTGIDFVTLLGGRDINKSLCPAAWNTMDGLSWVEIFQSDELLGSIENASMFLYDDDLYLFGGEKTIQGGVSIQNDTLYTSTNQGLTWKVADLRMKFRPLEQHDKCRHILTDDRYIYVFALKSGTEGVWKGFINRKLYDE